MKLSDNFIVHNSGEETLLVPTAEAGFHGLIRGNKSVDAILNCLLTPTTEEEIVKALVDRFDGSEADIRADVTKVLSKLREIGAIEEE